jgi:hypothetical protein
MTEPSQRDNRGRRQRYIHIQRYKDRRRYPRLNLARDFVADLLLILFVDGATRLFYVLIELVARLVPTEDVPHDVQSYLPIEITRWLVTVADGASILAFVIVAVGTLWRLVALQFSGEDE